MGIDFFLFIVHNLVTKMNEVIMKFLDSDVFFKYYNSMLNETLVKGSVDKILSIDESHVLEYDEEHNYLTPDDVLIGIIQTNPPKTNDECTFRLFKFDKQECASVFYRPDYSSDFFDCIYICKNDKLENLDYYINTNPYRINMLGYEYPKLLNQIIERYNQKDISKNQNQIISIVKQTSLFLCGKNAMHDTYKKFTNLQKEYFLNGTLTMKQMREKKMHEKYAKKVYYDTKTLNPNDFVIKYEEQEKQKNNEKVQ